MALLKRKQEKTTTLSLRVPVSVKQDIDTLRTIADQAGFDLVGSLADAVIKWTKQVHEELGIPTQTAPLPVDKSAHANGHGRE
jgi:hypothetical protein